MGTVSTDSGAIVGFEAKLWKTIDILRGTMDAAEYKHLVLGLIFLRYISEALDESRAPRDAERSEGAANVLVPPDARWEHIQAHARQPSIGQIVDEAMDAVERANPSLKGVLPKGYNRPALDNWRLGDLVDVIANLPLGDSHAKAKDVLGRVYEYFLVQFSRAQGSKSGEFYTPRCVVRLLVEMLQPNSGVIYDPCCGSGGMFVQSAKFVEAHATGTTNGANSQISIYGQELNPTTWRLAKMNLFIHGIEGQIEQGDTLLNDRFPDLKADFVLANPPFNMSKWGGERLGEDKRWMFGAPPLSNANFAWMQHIIHHLGPTGYAGVVLVNGSMSSSRFREGRIRKNIIEADLVDCMVALPDKLFYSTQIPACLWFLARDKSGRPPAGHKEPLRDRRGEVLFIDARKMGRMVDRTHRELTDEEIQRIARTYHAWRGEKDAGEYIDVPGFCRAVTLEQIRHCDYVLIPGRYVGAAPNDEEEDGEPFEEKMQRLIAELRQQQAEAARLDKEIWKCMEKLGYGG